MTDFPWSQAPPSVAVDLLALAAGRAAVRFELLASAPLEAWASERHLAVVRDESFAVVARSSDLAAAVLQVDRSAEPHLIELGVLLGYPQCCARHANELGEHRLDELAALAAGRRLSGDQQLIDISRYSDGLALVSHVPCSPQCAPSLMQAHAALATTSTTWDDDRETARRWRKIEAWFGAKDRRATRDSRSRPT